MTVIVWDGSTLATDCAANDGVAQWHTDKAWYYGEGEDKLILSGAGPLQSIFAMREWFKKGALLNEFPSVQLSPQYCHFLVVSLDIGLYRFEQGPIPINHYHNACAFGEGRDFAIGAMAMGADATQAVVVANRYSVHCGMGFEGYTL
jgi:hypothetical protein